MPTHEERTAPPRRAVSGWRLRVAAYLVVAVAAGHALLDFESQVYEVSLGLLLAVSLLNQASTADRLDQLERAR